LSGGRSSPGSAHAAPKPDGRRQPEVLAALTKGGLVDTDGDHYADVAFSFTFSDYQDGAQTGTAWYAI
jgi:hypothetical protein